MPIASTPAAIKPSKQVWDPVKGLFVNDDADSISTALNFNFDKIGSGADFGFAAGFGTSVDHLKATTALSSIVPASAAPAAPSAPADMGANFVPNAMNTATNAANAAKEWHLNTIRVAKVWDEYTGTGIKNGVYDAGVDTSNSHINYNSALEVSVNGVKGNALGDGLHGTSVAGLIAGKVDSAAVGVAFNSTVTSVNTFTGSTSGSGLISAMQQATKFDVINNSWGWTSRWADPASVAGSFGQGFIAALKSVSDTGRGGLGTIIVESAGNDGMRHTDGNASEFAASRHTITVGATTDTGDVAFYATRGADLLVSAPSGGGSRGLYTTDKTGTAGYSATDYTDSFSGTSGSAPVVSGVVDLMLSANKNLGWRDVQEILAQSSFATGSASLKGGVPDNAFWQYGWTVNGANNSNGGGLHFSNDVGYGQVDAYGAVRMAEVWNLFGASQTSANEQKLSYAATVNKAVGDNATASFVVAVDKDIRAEHADLTLTLTTGNINDLKIVLTSPDGTKSIVLDNDAASAAQSQSNWTWTFGSEAFHDELTKGNWTISVTDTKGNNLTSTIVSYKLDLYGATATNNSVYHYTDEFLKMLAADATRGVLKDTDGGTDWIDASAVSGSLKIDLHSGAQSTVDGKNFVKIDAATTIENVVTGDGNDTIYGNDGSNQIYAMRGNDLVYGSGGGDTMDGGQGVDTVDYSLSTAGVDVDFTRATQVGGYAQGDIVRGFENLTGSAYADVLRGDAGANLIQGGAGNDTLEGRGGADTLDGGDGIDTASYASSAAAVDVDLSRAVQIGGDAAGDVLRGIENVTGSNFADVLRGDANANVLDGGAGNDTIFGGANDTLLGGAGDDKFFVSGKGVVVDGGAGFDTIDFSTMSTGVVFDMVAGAGRTADGLTTVTTTNVEGVVGTAFNDTLIGGLASDSLTGGAGNDLLVGGKGSDTMDGGTGYDTVDYSASSAAVDVDFTRATQVGGDAQGDVLRGIEAVNGSAFNDVFRGDANANEFHAGAGNDTIFGSGGGDIVDGGTGTDTVNYSTSTAAVDVDLTRAVQIGGFAEGDKLTSIENVTGSNYNDTIHGDDNSNVLDGGAGNDVIFTGAGNDTVFGGTGDDRIVIDGLGSHRVDGGTGFDTIDFSFLKASVSYNLASGIGSSSGMNVTATGVEGVIGTAFNDVLVGGLGADKIDGGAGNDIIIGGVGNDTMTGGAGLDTFKFTGIGFGKDLITDFTTGQDKIDLSAMGVKSLAALAITVSGNDQIISLGNDQIVLAGHAKVALTGSDFLWA